MFRSRLRDTQTGAKERGERDSENTPLEEVLGPEEDLTVG